MLIYARLNDCERTSWILKAKEQVIDSTVSEYLPTIDGALMAQALMDKETMAAARAGDAGELDLDEGEGDD